MMVAGDKLKEVLSLTGLIEENKLSSLVKESEKTEVPLSKLLIDRDLISDENLGRIIADALKIPFVILTKISIPQEVLKIVPEVVAKKQKIIAFGKDKDGLKLAMADPENKEIVDFIQKKTGDKVIIYYATDRDIEQSIRLYSQDLQKTFDE